MDHEREEEEEGGCEGQMEGEEVIQEVREGNKCCLGAEQMSKWEIQWRVCVTNKEICQEEDRRLDHYQQGN